MSDNTSPAKQATHLLPIQKPGCHSPRLRQLLEHARSSTSNGPALRRLLEYIISNRIDPLPAILGVLDANLIPASMVLRSDDTARFSNAMCALMDLSCVLRCLHLGSNAPQVVSLRGRSSMLLMERWDGVMKWLVFHLVQAHSTSNPSDVLSTCIGLLGAIFCDCDQDVWKEELVRLPHTMDFVFALLCHIDPQTGTYQLLPTATKGCAIVDLVFDALSNTIPFFQFVGRLQAVHPKRCRDVITSIVSRAGQIASAGVAKGESAESPSSRPEERMWIAIESLYEIVHITDLILGDISFRKVFAKRDFISEYARALTLLCSEAYSFDWSKVERNRRVQFWMLLSETVALFVKAIVVRCSPNPRSSVQPAIKAGIVYTALRCLSRLEVDSESSPILVDGALVHCASLMCDRKAYAALSTYMDLVQDGDGTHLLELLDVTMEMGPTGNLGSMVIHKALMRGLKTFTGFATVAKRNIVQMCSNRNHARTKLSAQKRFKGPRSAFYTCSRCHTVSYCSVECQREDWGNYHSKECENFARSYQDRKQEGIWTPFTVRQDQLLYLEDTASEVIRQPGSDDRTSLVVFDFVSSCGLSRDGSRYHIDVWRRNCWQHINKDWDARVQHMCSEVQNATPSQPSILVEGIFIHNHEYEVFVLARMAWVGRWRVAENVWRMSRRSSKSD